MEVQNKVQEFILEHCLGDSANARLLDLVSEVGELAKEMLQASDYGEDDFSPGEDWNEEMGDVFFSLLCLANSTLVDLEKELERALKRYRRRRGLAEWHQP